MVSFVTSSSLLAAVAVDEERRCIDSSDDDVEPERDWSPSLEPEPEASDLQEVESDANGELQRMRAEIAELKADLGA